MIKPKIKTIEYEEGDPEIDLQEELKLLDLELDGDWDDLDNNYYYQQLIKLQRKSKTILTFLPSGDGTFNLFFENESGWNQVKELESINLNDIDLVLIGNDVGERRLISYTQRIID